MLGLLAQMMDGFVIVPRCNDIFGLQFCFARPRGFPYCVWYPDAARPPLEDEQLGQGSADLSLALVEWSVNCSCMYGHGWRKTTLWTVTLRPATMDVRSCALSLCVCSQCFVCVDPALALSLCGVCSHPRCFLCS